MELFLLCLLGILLGPTKIQAQDSLTTITPRSSLSVFPRQPDFQYKELQGKWYVLTSAEAPVFNETDPEGAWQSMTLELNDDNSYNVTIVWYSNSTCLNHYDVALPTGKPGVFTFKNVISYKGFENFTVRVVATDYKQFAMVMIHLNPENFYCYTLFIYGRTKKLNSEVIERCRCISRSLGLIDKFFFAELQEECIAD